MYGFPRASRLARAPVGELRRMQFTTRKAEYVVGLARRVATGELDLDALARNTNDEVIETLTAVRDWLARSPETTGICASLPRIAARRQCAPNGSFGTRKIGGRRQH